MQLTACSSHTSNIYTHKKAVLIRIKVIMKNPTMTNATAISKWPFLCTAKSIVWIAHVVCSDVSKGLLGGTGFHIYISDTLRNGGLVSCIYIYYLKYKVSNPRIADGNMKGIKNEVHVKVPTSEIQRLTCAVDSISSVARVAGAGETPHCVRINKTQLQNHGKIQGHCTVFSKGFSNSIQCESGVAYVLCFEKENYQKSVQAVLG